jgi:hypothetical protein
MLQLVQFRQPTDQYWICHQEVIIKQLKNSVLFNNNRFFPGQNGVLYYDFRRKNRLKVSYKEKYLTNNIDFAFQ